MIINKNKKIIETSALVGRAYYLLRPRSHYLEGREGRECRECPSVPGLLEFAATCVCLSLVPVLQVKDAPQTYSNIWKKRPELNHANPRRTKDVKQRCRAKRIRWTVGEEVNSLSERYHNKGNIPVRFTGCFTLPLGAIWNNNNTCACLSFFVNMILMLIIYWPRNLMPELWAEKKPKLKIKTKVRLKSPFDNEQQYRFQKEFFQSWLEPISLILLFINFVMNYD